MYLFVWFIFDSSFLIIMCALPVSHKFDYVYVCTCLVAVAVILLGRKSCSPGDQKVQAEEVSEIRV